MFAKFVVMSTMKLLVIPIAELHRAPKFEDLPDDWTCLFAA